MEQVIADLIAMRRAMQHALDETFGTRTWTLAPTVRSFTRSAADDGDPLAETVGLGTLTFEGTYPAEQWRAAADAVAKVGEEHGFDRLVIHADSPQNISFQGQDTRGCSYRFGMSVNTILSVRTGSHRWAGQPYTSLPERAPDQD